MSSPTGGEQSGTALASTDVLTQGEVSPNDARSYPPPTFYDEDSSDDDESFKSDNSGPTLEDEAKPRGRRTLTVVAGEPLHDAPNLPNLPNPPNPPLNQNL